MRFYLPHLDLGRALPGKAGEELDQPVRELQVLVVQRAEQTLKYQNDIDDDYVNDDDVDGRKKHCEVSGSCQVLNRVKTVIFVQPHIPWTMMLILMIMVTYSCW